MGRYFVRTYNIGPGGSWRRDDLYLLKDGRLDYVLRGDSEYYIFIGECYPTSRVCEIQ
jgi:hypothetical protein